jgi:c-di-GMP-binding flagellar brake protein YcgR
MADLEKNKRLAISGEATYRVKDSVAPPVTAIVREISGKGLKFVTTETLEIDTLLELLIKVSDGSDAIPALGKVTWQGYGSSKFFLETTIEFAELNPKNESRLLNYIHTSAENIRVNRQHVRCALVTDVKYALSTELGNQQEGISGDIGVEGMKLFVRNPVKVTAELHMFFTLPQARGEIVTRGKVVWNGQEINGMTSIGVCFEAMDDRYKKVILRYVNFTLSQSAS